MASSDNSFGVLSTLETEDGSWQYFDLKSPALKEFGDVERLPVSTRILLENLLRTEDGKLCTRDDIIALIRSGGKASDQEIAFSPARVLMQDFTGVPAVVDLAAMRAAMVAAGKPASRINPLSPVDLVIDHSVSIDAFASDSAFGRNVDMEMERNAERYTFLKWGQSAFDNFRVVPPGTGICHQVNLEYLAPVTARLGEDGHVLAPDTLVGTDSHTTMINGLGVLGWGVGGIEAEAAMLGQPVSMLIPDVVGFELTGSLPRGTTATDLVLRVVQMLRAHGVVGKFVEFFGSGLAALPLAERATIANMAPEYGATCGLFPVDAQTLSYLELSGRDSDQISLVEAYFKAQGLFAEADSPAPEFSSSLSLDISEVEPSLAGPKRPQDRVSLAGLKQGTRELAEVLGKADALEQSMPLAGETEGLHHGAVVVAAITSCTNTSNPAVMLAAGLVAKKAWEKGMQRKPWVKSSLAPGSRVVTDYLEAAGLQEYLDNLGFNLVGYGCTTCIGNSGPLPDNVADCIRDNDLMVCSVLSGNRNFEGRIHPLVQANWLASPPLVVLYALAGTTLIDLSTEPVGSDADGKAVMMADLWPSPEELAAAMSSVNRSMFTERYAEVFSGDARWQAVKFEGDETYEFAADSTYIRLPPFFEPAYSEGKNQDIEGARVLALLGDSVTTDHISPAGSIPLDSSAAQYLRENGVQEADFNSFGSRRGNHEVMMRGTFGNIRLKNEMLDGVEGGYTRRAGEQQVLSIYDAAMDYMAKDTPCVVIGGKEYGTGSSRDWAAKGTLLLGVKAVVVESFERIHRSNLVGMGVLPLQFPDGVSRKTLGLTGDEVISITGLQAGITAKQTLTLTAVSADGSSVSTPVHSRLDTEMEVRYFLAGGILHYVLEQLAAEG